MAANVFTGFLFERIGIKRSYILYFLVASLGASLYGLNLHPTLVPFLLLLTFYGVSAACMTNWLTNARLFPVIYASTTHGIASFFARLTNILAPQVAELS